MICPGASTRLSCGPEYESHIVDLHRRGLLDDASMRASLDAASPGYAAPLYTYLASDLAEDVTGRIFIAAGGFVGVLPRPTPGIIGYRDHRDHPPLSLAELKELFDGKRCG